MNTPTTHRGFTLIELMIALVVMALVLTLGVPSFRNIILDNRQVSELNVLVAELNWARSEAVARNAPVTLKRSGSSWNEGWQIFVDYDKDGVLDGDGDSVLCEPGEDCELRTHGALPSGIDVRFSRSTSTRITYDAQGTTQAYNGTFIFCDAREAKWARGLILSTNGRLKPTRDTNGDHYHEGSDGNALTCPSASAAS